MAAPAAALAALDPDLAVRWAGRLLLLLLAVLLALVLLVLSLVGGLVGALVGGVGGALGLGGGGTPSAAGVAAIPADQLLVMQQVAAASRCGLPWPVLAGVAGVESNFGQNMSTSSAGAVGYGQFTPDTWAAFGAGGNPYDYRDALPAMDRYLCALAAQFGACLPPDEALKRALFYYSHRHDTPYNPNDSYVRDVLGRAASYAAPATASGGGLVPGWADRPALDQFDCANYRSTSSCMTWRAVACSAAALKWLLGAYGGQTGRYRRRGCPDRAGHGDLDHGRPPGQPRPEASGRPGSRKPEPATGAAGLDR